MKASLPFPRSATAALLLLLAACTNGAFSSPVPSLPRHAQCRLADEDRQWIESALAGWRVARREFLMAAEAPLPHIVTYDAACSYALVGGSRWSVAPHRGEIDLPNGGKIPPAPNAFNAARDGGANFVVMALPSIWRPVAPPSEIPLPWFLEGVVLHELAHAYQSAVTPGVSFPSLARRLPSSGNVSDDSVQEVFGANAAYVRDYERERDLLFRAVSAPTDREARSFACDALANLRSRRARHFARANAHWAAVDEISLTTEGLGEWVSYSWLTRKRGVSPALVLSKLRGRYWSQEQGLAIFLTVDRLVPRWQRHLFSRSPWTAAPLLEMACGHHRSR